MRWYCLHPGLPEKAVLRIRTAPNSGAAVCGRVSKGKAIAALAPEFEIADDTLSLSATNGSTGVSQRWLHVPFPDELGGENMTGGYVMTSLPDGMRLLVPWEQADAKQPYTDSLCSGSVGFINCCRIGNASVKLFDGPSKTANVVGLAEEGEGFKYPYGVVAVEGSRACIVHDVLESVWIEIAELEPICVQLRHPNCSTPHAFYTLNEDLPPEAQIAIRCFPSKEAETMGLLSRGEVIEVVAQCENWLQVAAAYGEKEEAWIMWQTDSWTLLVEFPSHSSAKCARLTGSSDGNAKTAAALPDRGAMKEEAALADSIELNSERLEEAGTPLNTAATANSMEGPLTVAEMEHLSDHVHDQELLNGAGESVAGGEMEKQDVEGNPDFAVEDRAVPSSSWEDRPLNVRSSRGAGESNSDEFEQDATSGEKEVIEGDRDFTFENRAVQSSSWDDRPLNARSNRENGEVGSGKFEQGDQFQQNQHSSPEEDGAENESVAQQASLSSETSAEYWDDRPIRPQKQSEMIWNEDLQPTQDPAEHQPVGGEKEVHEEDDRDEETLLEHSSMRSSDNTSSNEPTSGSGTAWDEIPVSGGKFCPWDETPVGVQSESVTLADEEVEALHSESMTVDDTTEKADGEAVRAKTIASWDEMSVGGTGHRSWDETPVGGGNSRSWDETPVGANPHHSRTNFEDVASYPEPTSADDVSEMERYDQVISRDETPVGASSSLPWDERPIVAQSHNSSAGDEDTEVWEESMAEGVTEEIRETPAVITAKVSSWDEMPVGGAGHRSWDETPVGGGKSRSWDELPVEIQSQQTISGDGIEVSESELMIVDLTAKEDDDEVQTEAVPSWDETPLSASSRHSSAGVQETSNPEPMNVDEVHEKENGNQFAQREHTAVGDSSHRQWDEIPVGIQSGSDDKDVGVGAGSAMDDVTDNRDEDQVVPTERISSWNDTPVGGSRHRVWDETPVGGGSSRPWDETPVGARFSEDRQQESIAETFNLTTEPMTQILDERPAASSLSKLLESDLLSSDQAFDSESSSPFFGDHDQKGKLTLADLDEFIEPERDEILIGVTRSQPSLRSQETTPMESLKEPVQVDEDDVVMNEETAGDDTFEEASSEGLDQDTPSRPVLPLDDIPVRSDQMWGEVQASPEPTLAEESDQAAAVEEMIVDSNETVDTEAHDMNQSSPAWRETPVEPISQSDEDEEHFYESQDADQQLPDATQTTFGDNSVIEGEQSVTKREPVFSGTKSRVKNRSSVGGQGFAERRTRKPQFSHSNGNGGLSFLMEFGIRAYCRHKQILIISNEEVSQILFEAVVYGDDPEVILEALTADEPPCEDWMTFSPSKVRVVSTEPDAHSFLDVLYARDSEETPSTPRQMTLQHTQQQLRTPPHSNGTRKAKINCIFNRTPVKQRSTPTYDLIMNNADVDKILEAEFGNEACELSILGPYKYPTLTGSQMPGKPSRSPAGSFGVVNSGLSRFPVTTFQTPPSKDVEPKASIASGHPRRSDEELPPRFSTPPPTEESANPLKRAASAIAKTPPVQITKTASAPSVVSTAAEVSSKPVSTAFPPASRLGSRPSSTSSLLGTSLTLRRPSPQPIGSAATSRSSAADPAVPRMRSSLPSESSASATRSSITGALPRPQSFLQRKSFLPTPSPGKSTTTTPSASRNSMAGSIAQATDTSSLQARRTSFGFVRPKTTTTTIPKK